MICLIKMALIHWMKNKIGNDDLLPVHIRLSELLIQVLEYFFKLDGVLRLWLERLTWTPRLIERAELHFVYL